MNAEDFAKWESTPEGVHYQLGDGLTLAGVDSEAMARLITLTVAALPADVRQFVYDECIFASIGGDTLYGQTLPTAKSWLILLDGFLPVELSDDATRSIIAHEIAHAWLGHHVAGDRPYEETEQEARELARSWGFTGPGTEAAH